MERMNLRLALLALLLTASPAAWSQQLKPPAPGEKADVLATRKIFDGAKHCSSTDIFRWQNLWYVACRAADSAAGGEGRIQLLVSFDGVSWTTSSQVAEKGVDLRDPKLAVTKEDRLMLFAEGVTYEGGQVASKQPRVTTSTDGHNWVPPQKCLNSGDWIWRPTWSQAEQKFYAASYLTHPTTPGPKPEKEWTIKLNSSLDGKVWQLTTPWQITGQPAEATVRLLADGSMAAIVQRKGGDLKGAYGTSQPPFKDWTWKQLAVPMMGPNFLQLPNGRIVGASLGFGATPGAHVVIFEITDGAFVPLVELPSGGDCGHPGLAYHDDQLLVTYHSSHEDKKTAIYFAKVRLK